MLTILGGGGGRYCDRVTRRSFLRVGGLVMGGLTLPQLLRAEEQSGGGRTHKAVIMVFLSGGPPHQDMVDLKPDSPVEVRGEFQPIRTNVVGLDVCEHLPKLAQTMDHWAVIRSLVGSEGQHAAFQCLTGRAHNRQPSGGWPAFGAVVSKLQGAVRAGARAPVGVALAVQTAT